MRFARTWISLTLVMFSVLTASTAGAQPQNTYRLKPGAEGKLCLSCHPDFEDTLKRTFVHTPVKTGECSGCHNPHTAPHGKLLGASPNAICFTCHQDIVPDKPVSSHKVVVEGGCVKCHDPHASGNKGNILKAGNELCAGCHKTMSETIATVKFKHKPVESGCLSCHTPHASAKSPSLLARPMPDVCVECHKPDGPNFARQHAGYPVAKANCVSCHNPHGSNTAGILFDTVHAPVAAKRCSQCHDAATSPDPFKTRRPGYELCRACHSAMMNEAFGKNRIHWPLVDQTGCMHCHEPHAATQKKLLKADEASLCGSCHKDTMAWQATLAAKEAQEKAAAKGRPQRGTFVHDPIQQGACSTCHLSHASDGSYLMRQASIIDGCGTCHDWLKHNSHPMGDKYADSRNKNLTMDCLSCHRAHGTGYRYMITFPTTTDLCVQCHKQFRR
jgi:predicted CXXCH cytochrome family protein